SFVFNQAGSTSNDIYNDGVINFVGTAGVSAFTGGFGGAGTINQNTDGNMFGLTDTSDSSAFTGTFKQTAGTAVNQGVFFGGTNIITGGSLYWAGGAASKVDTSSLSVDGAQLFVRKGANLVLNNAADIVNQTAVVAIDGNSKISVQNAGAQLYLGAEDLWYGALNMTNGAVTLDNLKNTAGSNYAQNGGTLNLINGSVLTLGENSAISDGNITISSSTLNQNAIAVNLSGAGNAGWGNLSLTDARINAMDGVITENNFAGEMEITGAANFDIDLDPANRISDRYIFDGAVKNSGLAAINVDFFRLVSTPAEEEIPFQIFEGSSISGVDFTTSTPRVMTAVGAYDFGPIAGRDGWYLLNMVPGVFNPNTPRGPASVLAMLSAQLLANNVLFDHVFFDSNVMLSSENKCDYRFIPSQFLKENRQSNIWLKTYYETGGLHLDGFNLKTDMYGYMIGIDLPAKDMSADAYFLPTFYGGYTGAKETFAQTDMKQNALQAGFMASFMKNAYTAAGLIYGGVYHNHMNVEGFKDDVYNWFAGTAVKNSYNIYLDNLVVQPSLLGSYNFYGKQKWDSSYGDITMQSDYMNGFNVAPGINFIYGLKTWNFMLSGLYMINMGGAISGKAGNIDLPKVDRGSDYLEYGAGISKIFSQKFNVWAKAIFKTNRDSDFGVRAAAQWRF
ncbi:MAG: hypothetical protein LBG46_03300, partial [Elusimicrobiota bacterium]|nr:hypothetical protein [Elusimicrobiota bacterium]